MNRFYWIALSAILLILFAHYRPAVWTFPGGLCLHCSGTMSHIASYRQERVILSVDFSWCTFRSISSRRHVLNHSRKEQSPAGTTNADVFFLYFGSALQQELIPGSLLSCSFTAHLYFPGICYSMHNSYLYPQPSSHHRRITTCISYCPIPNFVSGMFIRPYLSHTVWWVQLRLVGYLFGRFLMTHLVHLNNIKYVHDLNHTSWSHLINQHEKHILRFLQYIRRVWRCKYTIDFALVAHTPTVSIT